MYSYLESRYYIIYGRMEGYLCRQHGVALVVGSAGAGQCSLLTGNGICLERAVRAAAQAPCSGTNTGDRLEHGRPLASVGLTVSTVILHCV